MPVTPLYAGLLGLLFLALSIRTIGVRRRLRIAVGDGGKEEMLRAMRVHANFAEYVPFAVVLLFLLETQGAPLVLVHALCAALVVGRLVHAHGVSRMRENLRYRVFGMALTFTALAGAAIGLLLSPLLWMSA